MPGLTFPAVTAATAGALGIWQVLLLTNVGVGRAKFKTGLGDGGHDGLTRPIRMHGNLTENAPLFLILLGLVELSGAWPRLVLVLGPTVVALRVCHVFGLSMRFGPQPNVFRAIGAGGTALAIVALSLAALWVVFAGLP
jgi:uncharacterized membrane protein YecN with MAPEG domain